MLPHDALRGAQKIIDDGYIYVVDLDLERFYRQREPHFSQRHHVPEPDDKTGSEVKKYPYAKANVTAANSAINGSYSLKITEMAKTGYLTGGRLAKGTTETL